MYLDQKGSFRPIGELGASVVSDRYLAITDPGLIAAWTVRLGGLPGQRLSFGLRFTRSFDVAILQRQFASLSARGIDFEAILESGGLVTTHARIDDELNVMIDRVSVEGPVPADESPERR